MIKDMIMISNHHIGCHKNIIADNNFLTSNNLAALLQACAITYIKSDFRLICILSM